MADQLVTAADLHARWVGGTLPPDGQITTLLGDAEQLIAEEFPSVYEAARTDPQVRGRVVRVAVAVVSRVLRNPDGIRSVSDTTGPFAGTTTWAGDDPGELLLTDNDRRVLQGLPAGQTRAFTIMPARPPAPRPPAGPWWPW